MKANILVYIIFQINFEWEPLFTIYFDMVIYLKVEGQGKGLEKILRGKVINIISGCWDKIILYYNFKCMLDIFSLFPKRNLYLKERNAWYAWRFYLRGINMEMRNSYLKAVRCLRRISSNIHSNPFKLNGNNQIMFNLFSNILTNFCIQYEYIHQLIY